MTNNILLIALFIAVIVSAISYHLYLVNKKKRENGDTKFTLILDELLTDSKTKVLEFICTADANYIVDLLKQDNRFSNIVREKYYESSAYVHHHIYFRYKNTDFVMGHLFFFETEKVRATVHNRKLRQEAIELELDRIEAEKQKEKEQLKKDLIGK